MDVLRLTCWSCHVTFLTLNDLSTHHLDRHERALPAGAGAIPLTPLRAERWLPPNHKAQSVQDWYGGAPAVQEDPCDRHP